jgi:hypothetical protein
MVSKSNVLVPTPLFRFALKNAAVELDSGAHCIPFDPSIPDEMLLAFRRLAAEQTAPSVLVLDVGHFWDETQWAFVSDAVGRSGANPLRGLGRIMKEPFVDVTRLYYVPNGSKGLEVIALGDRFKEYPGADFRDPQKRPVCSYLHGAAILAHAEGLRVSGVLVSESALPRFNTDCITL